MIGKPSRFAPALGALLCLASATPVSAQWAPFGGLFRPYPCGPSCGPVCQPAAWAPANIGAGALGTAGGLAGRYFFK